MTNQQELEAWMARVSYADIRKTEQIAGTFQNGKPLRGVMLADDLCLSRGKELYQVRDGFVWPITNKEVAQMYDATKLKDRMRLLLQHHRDFAKVKVQ